MKPRDGANGWSEREKAREKKVIRKRRNRWNRISKPLHFRSVRMKNAIKRHGRKYDFD